jgi:DNA-binding ferritin-like protein
MAGNATKFIGLLMNSRNQAHVFHFSTNSYSSHKALQKYYEKIEGLFDNYAEGYMGKYGRLNPIKINGRYLTNSAKTREYFGKLLQRIKSLKLPKDTYLENIKDEIIQLIRKTMYMLTLK